MNLSSAKCGKTQADYYICGYYTSYIPKEKERGQKK